MTLRSTQHHKWHELFLKLTYLYFFQEPTFFCFILQSGRQAVKQRPARTSGYGCVRKKQIDG